jgi:hypothetical protein
VRDPAAAAARLRDVLGVLPETPAERRPYSLAIGTTRFTLEPAAGPIDGRPASVRLLAGAARRLDLRRAHGAIIDLG